MLTPAQLRRSLAVTTGLAILVLAALLLLNACAASGPPTTWQEPVVRWCRLPVSGNPVAFGGSIATVESQDEAIRYIDRVVAGRIPGVRFYLVHYPVHTPVGYGAILPDGTVARVDVTSYREPQGALIVLSWWGRETPKPQLAERELTGWSVGDVSWEVEHMVTATDDLGNPWKIK